MGLFKADLYRNFAIGFGVGAMLVALQAGSENWAGSIGQTVAAILSL